MTLQVFLAATLDGGYGDARRPDTHLGVARYALLRCTAVTAPRTPGCCPTSRSRQLHAAAIRAPVMSVPKRTGKDLPSRAADNLFGLAVTRSVAETSCAFCAAPSGG